MNVAIDPKISCPKCKAQFPLTESLAAPLLESVKADYEKRIAQDAAAVTAREEAIQRREAAVAQTQRDVTARVEQLVAESRVAISREEAQRARAALNTEMAGQARALQDAQRLLEEQNTKLAAAQATQADLLRQQRELADKNRELDLTIEKRVTESLNSIRDAAKREAADAWNLKVAEQQQVITSMQDRIADLMKRAEQGSQQLQGEVQELELETLLRAKFPFDTIEPVPKGEFGGDAVQRVVSPTGAASGTILWESKRTKNWSNGWLAKLRDDQRAAKAECAIIVTQALPEGIETFDVMEGVWVTSPRCALPVATALRHTLIELSLARQIGDGQETKMEMVYQYLMGPRFRQRVEALVEAFSTMKEDLERERKAIMKQWARRNEQIERLMTSTVGMYGDLQGIAGKSLLEVEGLSLDALPGPTSEGQFAS